MSCFETEMRKTTEGMDNMRKLFGHFDEDDEQHCVDMDGELMDPFLATHRILEKIRFLYAEVRVGRAREAEKRPAARR